MSTFADAISVGFARFDDFQRLERRNRELEIARSLGGDGTTAFVNGILDAIAKRLSGSAVSRVRYEEG